MARAERGRVGAGIITGMAWVATGAVWIALGAGPARGQDATGLGGIGEARAKPTITNPFYRTPAWRLWTRNDMPVTIRDERNGKRQRVIIAPLPPEKRKYPDFDDPKAAGIPSLTTAESPPEWAGWWDDVAMTMDNGHSNVPIVGAGVRLGDQFMRVRFGYPFHPKHRLPLGCTFTTESLACRGRHIVDDQNNMRNTEQFFFFANTVRGTPGHASYNDNDPNRSHDDYDGLFGHQYQSIGQSSSEKDGIYKMLVAGGCMPRTTKDLLKLHGAFAPPLIAAWRASLPFVDEDGEEVPYANELRHRPVYSSRGSITHPHYSQADPYYHAYDDDLHIRRMIDYARRMDAPPAVAVMKMNSLAVRSGGTSPRLVLDRNDWHVKSTALTAIRLWAREGETLEATIDLTNSYDLTGRAISYHAARVYPNQTNVLIEGVRPGVYKVTVRPDANLPKMRLPVVFHATNGTGLVSNPVFLNVHYPSEGEPSDFVARGGARRSPVPVNDNRRPVPAIDWPYHTAVATPGETVSAALDATDPEGFDVRRYRWSGEAGRIVDGRYELTVEPNRPPCVIPAHVVFSDGTGAFKGELLKVIVAKRRPSLPDGYHLSTVGIPAGVGEVKTDGDRVTVEGVGGRIAGSRAVGTVLVRPMRGDFELSCEVESVRRVGRANGPAVAGLFARASLYEHAYFGMVGVAAGEDGRGAARWRGRNGNWSGSKADGRQGATRLRLIRRGKVLAGLTSTDGKTWRQLSQDDYEFGRRCDAGVTVLLDDAHRDDRDASAEATVRLLRPGKPVPIARVVGEGKGKPKDRSHVMSPTKLTVHPPAGLTVRYTIDGEAPDADSPVCDGTILVKETGSHEVRLRAFDGQVPAGPTVTVPFTAE